MVIGRAVLPVRLGCRVEVIGEALSVGFFSTPVTLFQPAFVFTLVILRK
jgi:hypothetical protein